MTIKQALAIATRIAAGRATITYHRGAYGAGTKGKPETAVRISGCSLDDAYDIGHEIAAALPSGAYRQGGDFACVWFNGSRDVAADSAAKAAHLEWVKEQA